MSTFANDIADRATPANTALPQPPVPPPGAMAMPGTITAYVPGEQAADYSLTSYLPVELLDNRHRGCARC